MRAGRTQRENGAVPLRATHFLAMARRKKFGNAKSIAGVKVKLTTRATAMDTPAPNPGVDSNGTGGQVKTKQQGW